MPSKHDVGKSHAPTVGQQFPIVSRLMTVDDRVSDERHARLVATGRVNGECDVKHKAMGIEGTTHAESRLGL